MSIMYVNIPINELFYKKNAAWSFWDTPVRHHPPPQLLSTRSLRPVLLDVPRSPSSRLHTLPLLGRPTKLSPLSQFLPLQHDVQLLPLLAYVHHFRLL